MDCAISHETLLTENATMLVLGRNQDIHKCFKI